MHNLVSYNQLAGWKTKAEEMEAVDHESAINDYFRNTKQHDRVVTQGSKIIDKTLNITDKDIEEAVLEGAQDLEGVQKKLKVGEMKMFLILLKSVLKNINQVLSLCLVPRTHFH